MPFRRGSKGTMGTCCLSLLVGVSGTGSGDSFLTLARSTVNKTERCEVATTSVVCRELGFDNAARLSVERPGEKGREGRRMVVRSLVLHVKVRVRVTL